MENKDISHIRHDYRYQEAGWKIQKGFWILVAAVLVYALLGGLGDSSGVLSKKTEKIPGGYIEYLKYLRVEKSFETRIILEETNRDFSVAINKDYIDKIRIDQVIPEPSSVAIHDRKIVYNFRSFKAGTITLFCDPTAMGSQPLTISVDGRDTPLYHYIFF